MAFCGVTFTEEKREFEIFPTIYPGNDFDAEVDAEKLYKAMKGIGTNEKKIIQVVTTRSSEQLKEVEKTFKTMYGDDLRARLKSELSRKLKIVVLGRFYDRYEYQAYVARHAMKGAGTDEQALIDVVCSKTSAEMENVKKAYAAMFDRDLVKDIESETSGDLKRILVALAMANREKKPVNNDEAKADAQRLYDAGEGTWGTDEKVFNQIFALRSFRQLKLTWLYYRKLSGRIIFEALDKELSGKLRSAFMTIAQYVKDPITYYSEMMYTSMKGLGTNDARLIRAILSRCEIDLETVKERYNKLHGSDANLVKRIKKETSGDYEKILVALVVGNKE